MGSSTLSLSSHSCQHTNRSWTRISLLQKSHNDAQVIEDKALAEGEVEQVPDSPECHDSFRYVYYSNDLRRESPVWSYAILTRSPFFIPPPSPPAGE